MVHDAMPRRGDAPTALGPAQPPTSQPIPHVRSADVQSEDPSHATIAMIGLEQGSPPLAHPRWPDARTDVPRHIPWSRSPRAQGPRPTRCSVLDPKAGACTAPFSVIGTDRSHPPDGAERGARPGREERPFSSRTSLWIPNCGSTSTSRCTWSGMTSISITVASRSATTERMMALSRLSMPSTSTLRWYLGHQTTWCFQENTTLWFDRSTIRMFALYSVRQPNAKAMNS